MRSNGIGRIPLHKKDDEIIYHGKIYTVESVKKAHGSVLYSFGPHVDVDELFVKGVKNLFSQEAIESPTGATI